MSYQPFLVADFRSDSGLDLKQDAWLTPAKAFETLINLYIKNGTIRKRLGQRVYGQCGKENVAEAVGVSGSTNYTHTLSTLSPIRRSVRVYEDGGGNKVLRDDGQGSFTGNGTGTINYTTGAISVTFSSATTADVKVDYVSDNVTSPIRGIFRFRNSSGEDQLLAMDSDRLHLYNTSNDYFFPQKDTSSGVYDKWSSTNLVWTASEDDKVWIFDYDTTSGIKTWDGTTITDQTLTTNASADYVETAHCAFFWEDRLVLFDTIENESGTSVTHRNRMRWSQRGDTSVWLDDSIGKGGYSDASTNEEFISARMLGNSVIVMFDSSFWIAYYTGNPDLPFQWRELSRNRNSASTFGSQEFDDFITSFGQDGLIACDATRVFNIDQKIPNFIVEEFDIDYIDKAYSVRDDFNKQNLLAYTSTDEGSTSNDRILVINYQEFTFSEYELSARCMGEWKTGADLTFEDLVGTVDDNVNVTWGDGQLQAGFPIILSGGSTGYVYQLQSELQSKDASNWQQQFEEGGTTATAFGFTAISGQLNPFKEEGIQCSLGYVDLLVKRIEGGKFQVDLMGDYDTEVLVSQEVDCNPSPVIGDKVWVRVEAGITCNSVTIKCYMTEDQLDVDETAIPQHEIYAYRFWFDRAGDILL